MRHLGGAFTGVQQTVNLPRQVPKKRILVDDDSDIDPDELLPVYLETKAKLLEEDASLVSTVNVDSRRNGRPPKKLSAPSPGIQKLQRKLKKIESDILFDQYLADQQWEPKRIELERQAATRRASEQKKAATERSSDDSDSSEDEVTKEAKKIAAELLDEDGSDNDAALADLFANLPVNEVDPSTGRTNTVLNGNNGVKIFIRDFGKWTGLSPQRILEEVCRSKDSGSRLTYNSLSESSYAQRHALKITLTKPVDFGELEAPDGIEFQQSKKQLSLAMSSIAAPDAKQSEAYVATIALFMVSASSSKDDKAALRLPPTWRDLYNELAEQRKEKVDTKDRNAIRVFRDMVRTKRDQELDDGVILHSAFRNRGAGRGADGGEAGQNNGDGQVLQPPEFYQRIWHDKSSTHTYQSMLVSLVFAC